jgi:hypothetical protein
MTKTTVTKHCAPHSLLQVREVIHLSLIAFAFLLAACGQRQSQPVGHAIKAPQNIGGANTCYGLACDGSTDSILIILPTEGDRLDTFDIVMANEQHRIFGRPHIGDELAVILTGDSTQEASMVVNLSSLQDTWCYMVAPTLNRQLPPSMPDSIRERIMAPREYSLRLKRDGTARAMGGIRQRTSSSATMSPVSYPRPKRYLSWYLTDGRLILSTDSTSLVDADTIDIIRLRRDSLVLRFSDHEQQYYRKKEIPTANNSPAANPTVNNSPAAK